MLKKIKDLSKNTQNIIIFSILLLIILICTVIIIEVSNKKTNEEDLINNLKLLGTDFYENFYYDQVGNADITKEEFLMEFEEIGIKVSLESLSQYDISSNKDMINEFINSETKEACNIKTTKVTIYPINPYGKSDYRIEPYLDCGFTKE